MTDPVFRPRVRLVAALVALASLHRLVHAEGMSPAAPPVVLDSTAVVPLVPDHGRIDGIAVKPTGQAFFVIDRMDRAITMIDLADPARREAAVTAFAEGEKPVAVACIDSITLAVVVRSGRTWSIRVYRLGPPGMPVEATAPIQSLALGESDREPSDGAVTLAVSPSRNWLVVSGLPEPMPPLLRGAIAGARVGGVSTRNCPERSRNRARLRPVAVAVSPLDELVLFDPDGPDPESEGSLLSMYSTVGAVKLLELATGLPNVRGAVHAKDALWVIAGNPGDDRLPEGLWRLDAAMVDRRQAVRPVCVAKLRAPSAIAALPTQQLLVVHGPAAATIARIDPAGAADAPQE
jgi:hypothetical protein